MDQRRHGVVVEEVALGEPLPRRWCIRWVKAFSLFLPGEVAVAAGDGPVHDPAPQVELVGAYFTNRFHAATGASPSAWRRRFEDAR